MQRLVVDHRTTYHYKEPVSFGEHRLMFRPRDSHDLRLLDAKLTIQPQAQVRWIYDVFSNSVAIAGFETPSDQLNFESVIVIDRYPLATMNIAIEEFARTIPFGYTAREVPDLGRTIERHDKRACPGCQVAAWTYQPVPLLPDEREQIADPRSAYQVVSMLQGVVQRGTGRKIASVGKPLAGKTGTTNESLDTWFIGFSPDLAVGVFIGFDEPKSLGPKETGSSVSAPVFRDFMAEALAPEPATPFRIPSGIRLVRVNAETGQLAGAADRRVILEAFLPGTMPSGDQLVIDGGYNPTIQAQQPSSIDVDSGLY